MPKIYLSSEEKDRRLMLSKKQAEEGEFRKIYCPECHQYLVGVYSRSREVISVKCSRCGFSEPIIIGMFRTVRKRHEETFEEFMARFPEKEGDPDENDTSFRYEQLLREC